MRTASQGKARIASMAFPAAVGWALSYSSRLEWAPADARRPSMVVALLFGGSAFLAIAYFPLLVAAVLVSIALGVPPGTRSALKNSFFLNGVAFLVGFSAMFALQSMAILPASAHGGSGNFLLEPSTGGLILLAALGSIFLSFRSSAAAVHAGTGHRFLLVLMVFFLGLGWGAHYGHDLDPVYDRTFFRIGAGPGSHEAPTLVLFGVGLVGLHALWAWGASLWFANVLSLRSIRLGAGVALALSGFLVPTKFHPF